MSSTGTLPRLPDELVVEIIRDSSLYPGDLARCALISKRYLDPVRRLLYGSVPIEVRDRDDPEEEDDDGREADDELGVFSQSPVVETLKNVPHLVDYVQELRFVRISMEDEEDDEEEDSYHTRSRSIVQAAVTLASNVRSVTFDFDWDVTVSQLAILSECKHLTRFSAYRLEIEPAECLFSDFPQLEHLHLHRLEQAEEIPSREPIFPRLRSVAISDPGITLSHLPFLRSGSPTLRSLRINLQIALVLDFSQFPELATLHLDPWGLDADRVIPYDVMNEVSRFWTSLARAPSLSTLSMIGWDYEPIYESTLLRYVSAISVQTIRTLRFEYDVPLDRLAALVESPLRVGLRRVVIHKTHNRESRKLNAIRVLCEGLELVFDEGQRSFLRH